MRAFASKLLALAALAACATACGPTIAINAGLKEAGADIFFGRPAPSPAPIPLIQPLNAPFPPPILPVPIFSAPPVALHCPTASPLAFPAHEAAETPAGPPAAGTYEFRYKGSIVKNPGATNQVAVVQVQAYGTRTISNVQSFSDGHFQFDVTESLGPIKQKNTYVVYPQSVAASALPSGVNPDNGIYLAEMQQAVLGFDFRPTTPVELMSLPAQNGAMTLRGTGTDGATTMQINPNNPGPGEAGSTPDTSTSYNAGRTTVDACGKVLQGWQVNLTGSIVTATGVGPNETFVIHQVYGTQYGGLSLLDDVQFDWTDATTATPMEEKLTATIDQEPKLAGA